MHLCKANIKIGGDIRNISVRTEYDPISWPEVEILMYIHGEESITDVIPFVWLDVKPKAERDRLNLVYGETTVAEVFGRKNPSELDAPEAKLLAGIPWKNPFTNRVEKTGKGGKGTEEYVPPPPPPSDGFGSRPAVEVVGQPMAGDPPLEDDAFDPNAPDPEPEPEPEPETPAPKPTAKKK